MSAGQPPSNRAVFAAAELPPLALYLHFPWCVSKCPYCDFNSHALRESLPQDLYLAALARDLESQATGVAGRRIESVFMGGGTPSLFSPAAISRVLEHARRHLALAPGAEVTLEANPGTIERGRFTEYRAAGVNRVSLGAQSFAPMQLAALGRIHTPDDTRRAAEELHGAGLGNFNLDLMYGLPGQTLAQAESDIEAALALSPAHLSHYHLTLEPGTPFAARPPDDLPAEDAVDVMLERCQARLAAAGFTRYEVSAYARSGAESRHNLNYWHFGDYLGVGAGAHGKISAHCAAGAGATEGASLEIRRTTQLRDPRRYLGGTPAAITSRSVPDGDRPFEFMLNALRLVEGFQCSEFENRTGLPWSGVAQIIDSLAAEGLAVREGARAAPSARGLRFLNDVLLRFLPPGVLSEAPKESQVIARS
ncbi:MAG: radical SAM family heme chaperone HemW [Steroidobacteraceae bacterium]